MGEAREKPDVTEKSMETDTPRLCFEQVHEHIPRLDNRVIESQNILGFGNIRGHRKEHLDMMRTDTVYLTGVKDSPFLQWGVTEEGNRDTWSNLKGQVTTIA